MVTVLAVIGGLLAPSPATAQAAGAVYYVYDPASRLVGVTNESGGGARYNYDVVGNITSIDRYPASQLSILGLSRWRGAVGATVDIYGTGFSVTPADNAVSFGATTASVSSANPNRLTVAVPSGAASGVVTVAISGTTASTSSDFKVGDFSAPAVSSFTPTVTKEGETVTLSGSAFGNAALDNNVAINGVRATVTSASATSVTAEVPYFATSGALTIGTPFGTATAGDVFLPPKPYLPGDVGWTGRVGLDSSSTVSVGTANQVGLLVFDANRGQKVSLQPSNSNISYNLTVYGPDGTEVIPNTFLGTSSPLLESKLLETSGTYTVLIDPKDTATGSVTIKVNDSTDITGTIAVDGPAVTANMTKHGQNAVYTFSGNAGQRVAAKASSINILPTTSASEGSLLIQDDSGTNIESEGFETGSYPYLAGPVTLPETGTYSVVADPEGTRTGSVVLQLFTVPADSDEPVSFNNAMTVTNSVAGQNHKLSFSGSQGQEISIKAGAVSYSPSRNPTLKITNPDGSTLLSDSGLSTNEFHDAKLLPATGTYTITIDPDQAVTGSTTVTVYDVSDITGSMTIGGPSVTPDVTRPGQDASYAFAGTAGERVAVKATNINVLPDNPGGEASLYIFPESGNSLGGTSLETGAAGELAGPVTIPATGTYTVRFNPGDDKLGSAVLELFTVPADTEQPITFDTATTTSNTVPGQNHKLTFSGTQNQKISIKAGTVSYSPSGTNPSLKITKPDGTQLFSDSSLSTSEFVDPKTLPATGTYTITIDPESTGTGSTTLTVYDASDVTGSMTIDGSSVSSTTKPGQEAWYTFEGTANQTVRLTATGISYSPSSSIEEAYMHMYKPDGTKVSTTASKRLDNGTGPTSMTDQVLPVTGTYKVRLDPYTDRQGSATLALTAVTGGSPKVRSDSGHYPSPSPSPSTIAAVPEPEPGDPEPTDPREPHDDIPPQLLRLLKSWRAEKGAPATSSPWRSLPTLETDRSSTALAGQVLKLNGLPLKGVTLQISGKTATTDSTGRFLITGASPGEHRLVIDGTIANRRAIRYGFFETRAALRKGETNALGYTIWMPRLDTSNAVSLRKLAARDVVVTSPKLPGLEVHLPKGSYLKGQDGEPVKKVTLTRIPTNRVPFPMPVDFPVYFTLQPGGAYIYPRGAQVVYPNKTKEAPGARVEFFNNDPDGEGWHVYGDGTVTEDGEQVVPDPDTRIYELSGASVFPHGRSAPSTGPNGEAEDGDPVDLHSGLFVYDKTDLALPGPAPITLTRTYRPNDPSSRDFGVGSTHPYDLWLDPSGSSYQADHEYLELILADGGRIRFDKIGSSPLTWKATKTPTSFFGATIEYWSGSFLLKMRNGTVMTFPKVRPLSKISDRFGNTVSISRTGDQITQITSSSGRWVRFTYDGSDRVTQLEDNIGRTVGYTYDSGGRLSTVTDARGGTTTYTYDANGRMDTITDPRNIVFLDNDYDSEGRVSEQTQGDGSFYTFDYSTDSNGVITQTEVTGPTGFTRRVSFNASGFMTSDIRAVGTSEQENVTYARDATSGLVQSVTDDAGRKTTFSYNSSGQPTSVTRLADTADARATSITYDAKYGRVKTVTEHGRTTTISYDDQLNRVTLSPPGPSGRNTIVDLNGSGQPKEIKNAADQITKLSYSLGDVISAEDPSGSVTRSFTDGAGRVSAVVDPLSNVTSYAYNNLNLMTSVTDPLVGSTNLGYDANGNLTSVTDARLKTTTFVYDNLDLLESRTDPLSKTESFDHNGLGQLVSQTDRRGKETRFSYDGRGRLKFAGFGALGTGGSTTYQSTIDYTFDDANRLTDVVDTYGGNIDFGYNVHDQLTSETTPNGTVTYTYSDGLRDTMTAGSETAVDYGYDSGGRLTSITKGTQSVGVTYDALDRMDVLTLPNGLTQDHDFDSVGRVSAITYKDGSTALGSLNYGYDKSSRRTDVTGSYARALLPDAVSSATYNDANQLTAWGTTSLSYDDNGNMTSDGTDTYTWNVRNQLSQISGGASGSFHYDSLGRRDEKTIGTTTTEYVFDGLDVAQEKDSSGAATANYLGGLGIDDVFTRTDSSSTSTFLTDALGSTVALADGTKAVTNEYSYEPYGKSSVTGTTGNAFTFTGRENDPGTGLMHYRARYYSPSFGRFVSEDPAGFVDGPNMYGYAQQSPAMFTDPTGLVTRGNCVNLQMGFAATFLQWQGCLQVDDDSVGFTSSSVVDDGPQVGGVFPFTAGASVQSSETTAADFEELVGSFDVVGASGGPGWSVGGDVIGGTSACTGEPYAGMDYGAGIGVPYAEVHAGQGSTTVSGGALNWDIPGPLQGIWSFINHHVGPGATINLAGRKDSTSGC